MKYTFDRILSCDFEEAEKRITMALENEGFGILTEISMHEVFSKKLRREIPRYKLLGACNPQFAFDAIKKEKDVGLLFPCKLSIQYIEEKETRLVALDPIIMFNQVKNPALNCIRDEIRRKLEMAVNLA